MANPAYPYWIVSAVKRSYDPTTDPSAWMSTRVQAENAVLARAMVERDLPSYAHIVSIAKEVWSSHDAPLSSRVQQ